MGAAYEFACSECGFKFHTSGPWEFYRDEKGVLKHYGHPGPCSQEAEGAGIYGLYGKCFCLDCQASVNVIMIEAKKPIRDGSIWLRGFECKESGETEPRCPQCSGTNLAISSGQSPVCPRCAKGRMEGRAVLFS